ncbi:MAG TPA: hypothetical protein VJ183_04005 [Chloroflexia bacterium]|nr:hypothetical protein [Chloroflexia bacterium]
MNKPPVIISLTCFLLLISTACDSDLQPPPTQIPLASPTLVASLQPSATPRLSPGLKTPIPLPPTAEVAWRDMLLPTWTPDSPGATPVRGMLLRPNSARVQQGQAYEFGIFTHCGVDHSVDFDGSFWDLANGPDDGNAPIYVGNPGQKGIMTLVDPNHARFDYSFEGRRFISGQLVPTHGGSIDFVRHAGPKHIMPCY